MKFLFYKKLPQLISKLLNQFKYHIKNTNLHFLMQEESTSLCDTKYKIVFLGDMGVGIFSIEIR